MLIILSCNLIITLELIIKLGIKIVLRSYQKSVWTKLSYKYRKNLKCAKVYFYYKRDPTSRCPISNHRPKETKVSVEYRISLGLMIYSFAVGFVCLFIPLSV